MKQEFRAETRRPIDISEFKWLQKGPFSPGNRYEKVEPLLKTVTR